MEIERVPASGLAEIEGFYLGVGYAGGVMPADTVLAARSGNVVVGAVRLCEESDCLILRGMYVSPSRQRTGVGRALLAEAAARIGRRECWCIPFVHLRRFYGHAGFEEIAASSAPGFLAARCATYAAKGAEVTIMVRPQGWQADELPGTLLAGPVEIAPATDPSTVFVREERIEDLP